MNAPISRSLAALLAIGAVAVLLIGAYFGSAPVAAPLVVPADSPADLAIESPGGPELPAGLSPGLAEIIKMARAHVDENVILAFIHNSGQTYSPTADEILYLTDLGLSQTVVAALFKQKPPTLPETVAAPDPAPIASTAPLSPAGRLAQQSANPGTFYTAMAPYGTWIQIADYGLCWQPTAETLNRDWRPYVDQGQWLDTDNGWYWQSDYSWGWAAFHYGRWAKNNRFGWVWAPDKVWGPAWVSWRIALTYAGWAPLPPGVGLAASGLTFNNRRVTADFDFGLPIAAFTFVSEASFLRRNLPAEAVPASQAATIYARSMSVNNYSIANQKVLNQGPGRAGLVVAEAEATPLLITKTPAGRAVPNTEPRVSLENEPTMMVAAVSRERAATALPRPSLGLPIQPVPQPSFVSRKRLPETYPSYSNLAGGIRWDPPVNHEIRHPDPAGDPIARVFQPEPERITVASIPTISKSGK